ncbi:hypothetical protein H4R26_006226, partial [Coemansia thaxteri]
MGLSIGAGSNSPPHDLSPIGSVADLPDECRLQEIASCSVSRASSLAPTSSPPKSPVLSARSISPGHERCPAQTQPSGASGVSAAGRPRSSALKRGGLGLYNSNNSDNVSTLADEFGQSLNIISRPPLQSASSQSSGASSGFNANSCANSALRQLPPSATIAAVSVTASNSRQRKRKAGEAGVVGKTKGGFEVVWSATDSMSTSYVMVPVPKTVAPESPAKMHKPQHKPHSRLAAIDGDSIGSHSQPNLKRVLESITREINLDSSYVLLLPPPPPPVAALGADGDQLDGDSADDEFGYLTTTVLRRVKSEI